MRTYFRYAKFREAVNVGTTSRQNPMNILRPGPDVSEIYTEGPFVWIVLAGGKISRVSPLANLVDAEVGSEPSRSSGPALPVERPEPGETENPPDPDEDDAEEGELPVGEPRKRGRPPKARE